MGRAEKALLGFLIICVAAVGTLTLQTTLRAREARHDGGQPATIASSSSRAPVVRAAGASSRSAAHVSATVIHSARSAPIRDVAALRRTISSGASGTYIDFMLLAADSSLCRWPDRYQQPVRVWIEPSSLPGWSASMSSIARDAFGLWRSAALPVRFDFVADSAAAEVLITWRDHFEGARVGATKRFRDQHGWLGRAEISLALRTAAGDTIGPELMGAIAVHEVGHALGLDHSPHAGDIMADRTGRVFEPTPADQGTLALIYAVPPGVLR